MKFSKTTILNLGVAKHGGGWGGEGGIFIPASHAADEKKSHGLVVYSLHSWTTD